LASKVKALTRAWDVRIHPLSQSIIACRTIYVSPITEGSNPLKPEKMDKTTLLMVCMKSLDAALLDSCFKFALIAPGMRQALACLFVRTEQDFPAFKPVEVSLFVI